MKTSSSLVFSPKAGFWQEPEPSQATGMALAHRILGSFLGVGCHCFPPSLDVPTFASRCLHVQATWETSISEIRNYEREMAGQFCLWFRLPRKPRVLWHAAQICDMGDGFTSPQGRHAVDFFARKIRRLRPGSNPRSWVPDGNRKSLCRIPLYRAVSRQPLMPQSVLLEAISYSAKVALCCLWNVLHRYIFVLLH